MSVKRESTVFKGKLIEGCINDAREEGLVVERSLKPKQIDIVFTFINFDPCGEQSREGSRRN